MPVITSIINGSEMVTDGGTRVTLRGVSFGPVGTPVVVNYGPLRADASGAMQATNRYTATNCSVTQADVEIQCLRYALVCLGIQRDPSCRMAAILLPSCCDPCSLGALVLQRPWRGQLPAVACHQ